jgi:histidine triad (HIT) family protein
MVSLTNRQRIGCNGQVTGVDCRGPRPGCGLSPTRCGDHAPMPSIFSRIIAGAIPGEFIFQDDLWVALMDIAPAAPGHVLLIPRAECQFLAELPAATLAALGDRLARLTTAVKAATGAPAVNVLVNDGPEAGQAVPHVHLHIIPRFAGDGKHCHPKGGTYADGQMHFMAAKLRSALT